MRLFCPVLLTIACLAATAGCSPAKPSTDYAQARSLWTQLLQEKLDQAAGDPRAERVLELLRRVPADSRDGLYAQRLRTEIEAAQRETAAERQRHAREIAQAESAARGPSLPQGTAGPTAPPLPPPQQQPPAAADATEAPKPPEKSAQPLDGMDAAAFRKDFSRCFEYRGPALIGGRSGGEVWTLKDLIVCRELHPDFGQKSVLLFENKVAVRPNGDLARQKFRLVDGQLVSADAPDDPKPAKDGRPAAPQPEAGPSTAPAAP